ncbi:MAG: OPT family oligopeptide transporter [Candidatus Sericytochromatia bacterium]|nr:OPT family oligopeptide transporter [Candidatus Sericytochromatia bacterium]
MTAESHPHPPHGTSTPASEIEAALRHMAELSPDDREAYWYDHVYRGNVKQLTIRAVLMGMLIGGVMSVSNLYVGLKTGWGFGVTITAGILAYAIFRLFEHVLPGGEFTDLENNAMQSVSSAAGFMASAGLTSAIPALLLLNGTVLTPFHLFLWIGAISIMGVFIAIPMKRQMINIDQLPFPSGIAAAETIKSLHGHGEVALAKAKSLGIGGVIGAVVSYFKDLHPVLVEKYTALKGLAFLSLPNQIPADQTAYQFQGINWQKLTLGLNVSLLLYAAGAIIGMRTGVSVLIGSVLNWFVIAPWLIQNHVVANGKVIEGGLKQVAAWTTWPGTGMLVVSTLVGLGLIWPSLARGFSGITEVFKPASEKQMDARQASIEVPGSWFLYGFTGGAIACVILQVWLFKIHWAMAILAVLLAVVLSMVVSRVTGETDISPTGAMGKVTQLTYGALAPGQPITNLMTANVTAGAAIHSADLLTDLKSGYLLGANPRQQFLAQMYGVLAGTLFCIPAYFLLVPNASVLGDKFAAPGALVWKATAEALARGLSALPPSALKLAAFTITVGVVITFIEHYRPALKRYLPSPTGLGLALVLPFSDSLAIFLGAFTAWWLAKARPATAERHTIPFSSGIIAGESIASVLIIALLVVIGAA